VRRLLLLFIAAVTLLGAACGAVSPFAAIVNGQRVTQRDLDRELKAIKNNKDFVQALQAQGGVSVQGTGKGTFDMAFVSRVLTRRIFFTLIHQQVEKRHIKIKAADLTAARNEAQTSFGGAATFAKFPRAYINEAIRTTAEISALQGKLGEGSATPEKIKAYYEANMAQFQETCLSHILVDDEAKAKDLKAQIDKGADFAELAKKESKDNQGAGGGSAAKGGSLDCISEEQSANFVPEFVAGYKDLPIGKVSDPVKSQFGYHLIKVTERKQQTLEDATADIKTKLGADTQQAFNDLITSSARKAKVRVNPRYGKFDTDQLTVVPPTAPPAAGTPTSVAGLPFQPTPGG
jgi:foldase protein PrsA